MRNYFFQGCFLITAAVFLMSVMTPVYAASTISKTVIIKYDTLVSTRSDMKKNPVKYSKALAVLVSDAEEIKKEKIHSVIEKDSIPASGDKHDYMSLRPYFWPDPEQKDGLPYIKKDGEINPETYSISDKRYFQSMPSKIFTLALCYFYTGDDSCADKAAEFLKVWFVDKRTAMNPHLKYAQVWKGVNDGSTSGIIDGRNIILLTDALPLLDESKSYTVSVKKPTEEWLGKYAQWLFESDNGKREAKAKNNHGTWYEADLAALFIFLGRNAEAEKIFRRAMTTRIPSQFKPGGLQPEELKRTKALWYSVFNIKGYFLLAHEGERFGIDIWNFKTNEGRCVKEALDYLMPYMTGESEFPYKQIVRFDASEFTDVFMDAWVQYGDVRYLNAARRSVKEFQSSRQRLLYPGIE